MLQLIGRRLLMLVPVLVGILAVTFAISRLIPGDPCFEVLGERATAQQCADFRERYGLNHSIPVQFASYVVGIAQGDFGESIATQQPVVDILLQRLPMTFELAISAAILATFVGVILGTISAVRQNSKVDVATMIGANIGVSMPVFWLGLLLAYLFAILLKGTPFWLAPSGRLSAGLSLAPLAEVYHLQNLPVPLSWMLRFASNMVTLNALLTGRWDVLGDALRHLILPVCALATVPLAITARMTRACLLEVLHMEYIGTARAKGLPERTVIWRHALRNAMLPVATVVGHSIGGLLGGAVLIETVFALPGMGTQLLTAILARDYPVVQAFTVVIALIFVLVNLAVDISYAYFDPRVRLQ
jgi:peptide/nickel transport system permease protein